LDPWIVVCESLFSILPATHAIIVDLPILFVIIRLLKGKTRQQKQNLDMRRVIRLGLLILVSILSIVCGLVASLVDIAPTAWCVVGALEVYVALDLYIMDMQLLKGETTSRQASMMYQGPKTKRAERKASKIIKSVPDISIIRQNSVLSGPSHQ